MPKLKWIPNSEDLEDKNEFYINKLDSNNELVESIEEKPSFSHYVNAGIYLIDPVVLDFIVKDKPMDMPELLTLLIKNKMQVSACPIHEYWLDVGQPETLSKAKQDWVSKKVKIH